MIKIFFSKTRTLIYHVLVDTIPAFMAHPRKKTSKTKRCIGDYKEKEYHYKLLFLLWVKQKTF